MLIFRLIKPKQDEEIYIPQVTEVIDTTPWKYTLPVGLFIVILVLATYVIF